MKLEVGTHVRLQNSRKVQYIGKIININEYREQIYCVDLQASDYVFVNEEDILKAQHNIIDLVEEGDYVNGCKITSVENGYLGFGDYEYYITDTKNIKSIVTKEQFKSNEYVVE